MFSFFLAWLSHCAPMEVRQLYARALDALAQVGYEAHEDELEQLLTVEGDLDNTAQMDAVAVILRNAFNSALLSLGVVVEQDAPMATLVEAVQGLVQLDNYDDPDTLAQLCEQSQSPASILADILEAVGTLPSDEFLMAFTEVSPALIERIASLNQREEPADEIDPATTARCQTYLREFAKLWPGNDPSLISYAIADGLRVGMDLDLYWSMFKPRLEEVSADKMGPELLGIFCATLMPAHVFEGVLSHRVESLVTSADEAIKVVNGFMSLYTPWVNNVRQTLSPHPELAHA